MQQPGTVPTTFNSTSAMPPEQSGVVARTEVNKGVVFVNVNFKDVLHETYLVPEDVLAAAFSRASLPRVGQVVIFRSQPARPLPFMDTRHFLEMTSLRTAPLSGLVLR